MLFRSTDDRLLMQEIDGGEVRHRVKGGRGGGVLLGGDPPGMIGGGKDGLVILRGHGGCGKEEQ